MAPHALRGHRPRAVPAVDSAADAAAPAIRVAMMLVSQGDKNSDQKVSRDELNALADAWFDKLDPEKSGKVAQAISRSGLRRSRPSPPPGGSRAAAARSGPPGGNPLWPEFNKMAGGYFKFHWDDPQEITYKIDDPKSPLTAMFKGAPLVVHDETYTFNQIVLARERPRAHEHRLLEDERRGQGEGAHARDRPRLRAQLHSPRGQRPRLLHGARPSRTELCRDPLLEHLLAGVQYALGDLKADDSPSVKPSTK